MPITERDQLRRENERIADLLKQGLSTDQIHQRTGAHKRRILRVKAKLKQAV